MGERYIPRMFRDITVGQQVVIARDSWIKNKLEKTTIVRFGPTKIWTDNGDEFSRTSGKLWGEADSWHPIRIKSIWHSGSPDTLMTWEEADKENADLLAEEQRRATVKRLSDWKWGELTVGQTQQVLALLESFTVTDGAA